MMAFEMEHLYQINNDGTVHVQNWVGPFAGQHHVHTKEGFEAWRKNVAGMNAVKRIRGQCACRLKPGQVRDYDGRIWSKFAEAEVTVMKQGRRRIRAVKTQKSNVR